jgi:AraC-like DNA-binding protein
MRAAEEWSRFYTRPQVYDIAFIHAAFVTHAFPWHVHDYYAIGVIETGRQTFSCRGSKHRTPVGGIFVVHPDEPHTGEPAIATGFTYRTFYPSADLMAHAAAELTGTVQPMPYFPTPVIVDDALSRRLVALHRALIGPASTLEGETRLLATFADLIARHADGRRAPQRLGQERAAIRRARAYMDAHYDRDLSLTDLARIVDLSPFYLARVFRAEVGMPPHAYLESVRIRAAQGLLASGTPLAEVAYATGFADQSHFTRRFRRCIGVTPGAYLRQRKIVQDAAGRSSYPAS